MRILQGAIIIVGLLQMAIGYSSAMVPMLRYIGPVTIAPVIAAIGLSLYGVGFNNVSTCFEVGLIQLALTVLFSQYMKKITIAGYPIFALFPIILAIAATWSYASIRTAAGAWDDGSQCRTDGARDLLSTTPWFRLPYPGQWGAPRFESFAIVPMIGSMLAGMIESIGDYYSCARLSGKFDGFWALTSRLDGSSLISFSFDHRGTATDARDYQPRISGRRNRHCDIWTLWNG
jgi:nucleobase transporter 1/2